MFRSAVNVQLGGDLDQARLDALRSALRLEPEGRLSDAYDQIQGQRIVDVPGGRLKVLLIRDDVGGPWSFRVNAEDQPSTEALRAAEAEVVAAAEAAGMAVVAVSRRET
jgi:hypothetical protein